MEREGALLGQDTGWQEVTGKKKRHAQGRMGRLDVATGAWKISYKDTFSFYFSDFPETHGAKDMLKAFKHYGDVMEVVIPPKRDKWGKRFGFVRFSKVGDPRAFAIELDKIIFGAKKIHVNIPRYQREWNDNSKTQQVQQQRVARQHVEPHKNQLQQRVQKVWRKKEGGDMGGKKVERHEQHNQWKRHYYNDNKVTTKVIYHRKNNLGELCYTTPEEELQKFKKMYVGTVRTPGSTYCVQEWFNMQGFFSIKITPLGANKVLMEEMDEGVISDLMNEYKDWMYEKFEDIRGWDPDVVDNERVVWVRCHGIPIHAWNDDFFASLARNFGEYLGVDETTRTKAAMDIARIRLRSKGYDVFNSVVTANINESLFHIKMVEEWCGPLHWIDNNSSQKGVDSGDSTESDDDHDGEPPLFTVEDECFSNFDEEGDGGESNTENEEERDEEYDEVSIVQETIEVHDERRLNNDCDDGGKMNMINVEVGNPNDINEISGGIIKEGKEVHEEVEKGATNITHVSDSRGCGGTQEENSIGVVKEKTSGEIGGMSNEGVFKKEGCPVENDENNTSAEVGDINNEGGCEEQGSLAKVKKRKKKCGLEKEKKKEKRKKKKEKEAQFAVQNTIASENSATQHLSQRNNDQFQSGVVRNPINQFQPSSSASLPSKSAAPASQVESIGDSGIAMGNCRYEKVMERSKAEKLWCIAKNKLGVSADDGDDEMYIKKIKAMEERDEPAKGTKGKPHVSK